MVVIDNVKKNLAVKDVTIFGGTSVHDIRETLDNHQIDIVIMGAGIDIDTRCDMIKVIFSMSDSTTVHMKDSHSGNEGMVPFVNGILRELTHAKQGQATER